MQRPELFGVAVVLCTIGVGMVIYERSRTKAGRPFVKGSLKTELYWMTYFFTLIIGIVALLGAII